jgi:ABC-type multidrug transport system ATPase subunit
MIQLIGVDKSYAGRRILNEAALTVRAGESVALVGANGSGKTTTLRCIAGLACPERGSIRVDGIDAWTDQHEARSRLSYLAQRTEFPLTLTVREILQVVADLRGATAQAVDREISLCGLGGVAARTAATLSGGERQRVAMAALLLPDVGTYLLDEPTLNLDPTGTRLLVERLRALRDAGRAVLFTTHVRGDIDELATRVALLRDGRFEKVGDQTRAGERHVSVAVGDKAERWVRAALDCGATHAWAMRGRLHAIVRDAGLSRLLEGLGRGGACISAFRTENALAAALDTLNDEEEKSDMAPVGHVDRRTAVGQLWRRVRWAGADSSGSR